MLKSKILKIFLWDFYSNLYQSLVSRSVWWNGNFSVVLLEGSRIGSSEAKVTEEGSIQRVLKEFNFKKLFFIS